MKRAVITGYGLLSPLGNNRSETITSLKTGRSGVVHRPDYVEHGLACNVAGTVKNFNAEDHLSRKELRFMGRANTLIWQAAQDAIAMSQLEEHLIQSDRTAIIAGTGGSGVRDFTDVLSIYNEKGARRVPPYYVVRIMTNSVVATLSTGLKHHGASYSMGSACATSLHTIGHAMEQIQLGKADIVLAGGAEEEFWATSLLFDAMKALSTQSNDDPERASRPFDETRDGFVPSEGAGIVIVEELEHAVARGANIIAEITGYGATSDGADPVAPSGKGADLCMRLALKQAGVDQIDYLNAHGTSTPAGDMVEIQAARNVFGDKAPPMSSTKALMGHALGAAGVLESIFSLIMMEEGFLTPCYNLTKPDAKVGDYPLIRELESRELTNVMSNSFGFGGTNASVIFSKYTD